VGSIITSLLSALTDKVVNTDILAVVGIHFGCG